ncbi:MAG TPA: hypothetical protein PL188_04550 [Candidatus Cloacimonadota bacterium]|nr:hypothetical protein [Candidatus Cloacimonadota bacterium]
MKHPSFILTGRRIMSSDSIRGNSNTKIIEARSKLQDVAISLGRYNLDYLLQLCSFLSIMSFLNFKNKTVSLKLWLFFNPNFIKNLSKAILLSNSNTSKQGCFHISEFINVFKRLKDIDTLVYHEDAPGISNLMLASIANTQVYYQEADFARDIGRSLLLYDQIPEKYGLKNERWIDVFQLFQDRYDISISKMYPLLLAIVMHNERRYEAINQELEKTPERMLPQTVLNKFHSLMAQQNYCTISITNEDIPEAIYFALSRYYDSISVPIRDVKSLVRCITSSIMVSDWHPFRVQPLVTVAENQYIVPSIWELVEHAKKLHTRIVENLNDDQRKQLYTNLGLSYEKYVFDYMVTTHPYDTIIAESNFSKSDLGPDVTILDVEKNMCVFIEVKTASIPLPSRNDPLQWDSKLSELVELVDKLHRKAIRVFSKEGHYRQYEHQIDHCQIENSILIVVCGDLGYFFDAILIDKIRSTYPEFPTNNILFLDIVGVENLIEYSSQNSMTLCQAFKRLIDIQNSVIKDTNIKPK